MRSFALGLLVLKIYAFSFRSFCIPPSLKAPKAPKAKRNSRYSQCGSDFASDSGSFGPPESVDAPNGVDCLVGDRPFGYTKTMILIHFPNPEAKRSALSSLAGRFGFKSWSSGEMLVPEDALPFSLCKAFRSPSRGRHRKSKMLRHLERSSVLPR